MFGWLREKLPSVMDELERFTRAEDSIIRNGTLPPSAPNRMQCAPNPNDMLEAFNTGMDLGEYITENAPRAEVQSMDQFVDTMGASLFTVSAQLWKDTKNLKNCMKEQDQRYEEEMEEYVEKVKTVADEDRPAAVTPQFSASHNQRTQEQKFADFRQCNDTRSRNGQPVVTWWEYEAMMKNNTDPVQPESMKNVTNSVLCPNGGAGPLAAQGGYNGGGSRGGGGGSGSSGSGSGSGNYSGGGSMICFKDDNGDFTKCYR